jgi:hypothetical protein
MNFFFGLNNDKFSSVITIPKFSNEDFLDESLLVEFSIKKGTWHVSEDFEYKEDELFYYIKETNNYSFYTLIKNEEKKKFYSSQINNISNLTFSKPAYRANFKVFREDSGYSSYQQEYPYGMMKVKGNIVSSISSVLNKSSIEKYVLFRNIYYLPINVDFNVYLVNLKSKSVLEKFNCLTNKSNFLKINDKYLDEDIYLVSKGYIGIPIYIEVFKDGMISMEHTHPPHSYVLEDRKQIIYNYKKKFIEIIN